jgi:hypothetical protein
LRLEPAGPQSEEFRQFLLGGEDHVRCFLAPGGLLRHPVDPPDVAVAGGGRGLGPPSTGGDVGHREGDRQEEDGRFHVVGGVDRQPEVGRRMEEVERQRRHDGGADTRPAATDGRGQDDHDHQHQGDIGVVHRVPHADQQPGHEDGRDHTEDGAHVAEDPFRFHEVLVPAAGSANVGVDAISARHRAIFTPS